MTISRNADDEPFSEELDLIMEAMDIVREKEYPNLERIGCPDSQILRDLAFRRAVASEITEKIVSHMWKCASVYL